MNRIHTGLILYNDISLDTRVLNEINILKDHYEISLLCAGEGPQKPEVINNLDVEYFSVKSIKAKFEFISSTTIRRFHSTWSKKIKEFSARKNLDVIHAHDLYMLPASLSAGKELNIPVIADLHENYKSAFRTYSWTKRFPHRLFVNYDYWDRIERKLLPQADGIIVLSETFRDKLIHEIPDLEKGKFAIYPNVPDIAFYEGQKMDKSVNDEVFRLFYLGVIGYSRGLHVASEGIKLLIERGYKVELHIAGKIHKNDQNYFENEVRGEHIVHIPWIDLEELGDYLSNMDLGISPIFKNPQHDSGVANKVFQYMLFGKPVLVSNSAAQKDLVESEKCGLVHQDKSAKDFADKVEWFINHGDESREMGLRGRKSIIDKYNIKVMGKGLLALYNSMT